MEFVILQRRPWEEEMFKEAVHVGMGGDRAHVTWKLKGKTGGVRVQARGGGKEMGKGENQPILSMYKNAVTH